MEFELPTRSYNLYKRSDTTSTAASASSKDSNGCVICSSAPDCPTCDSDEKCVQTIQTCSECPKTYCKSTGSSSSSSSGISGGGVAGGVIGGVALLAALLYIFYRCYIKKKFSFNRVQPKEYLFDDNVEMSFHHNLPANAKMNPHMKKQSSRSSITTSMISRASNIIPIAYIPGVTIGSGSKGSRASIVSRASDFAGDRLSKASIVGNPSLTTTAIRAKPKLVHINSSDGVPKAGETEGNIDTVPETAVSANHLGGVKSIHVNVNKPYQKSSLKNDLIIEEDEDSDLESPSSATKNNTKFNSAPVVDYEPFIIDDDVNDDDGETTRPGSMLLEVEMDTGGAFNPFTDKFSIDSSEDDKKEKK